MKKLFLCVLLFAACDVYHEPSPPPSDCEDEDGGGVCDTSNERAVGSLPQPLGTCYNTNRTDQPIGINQNLALQSLQILTAAYPSSIYSGSFHCWYPGSQEKWVCYAKNTGNYVFQSRPLGVFNGWRSFEIIYPGIFGATTFYASTEATMPTPSVGYHWHFATMAWSPSEEQGSGWVKGTTTNGSGTFSSCNP